MQSPDYLRLVAACASGKRVEVSAPGCTPVVVNGPSEPEPPPKIDYAELRREAERLEDRAVRDRAEASANRIEALLVSLIEGQRTIVETLHMPVIPKYDKNGLVIEGRRKKEV